MSHTESVEKAVRFLTDSSMKWGSVYAAILQGKDYEEPNLVKDLPVDKHRLNDWLRRQTRKHLGKIQVMREAGFTISPRCGYSYKNGVMWIAGRQPRKRVEIPLRDGRQFNRQLHMEVKEDYIVLTASVTKESSLPEGWENEICMHIGDAKTESFINAALNRMLSEEKPCHIVITHPIKVGKDGKIAKPAKRRLARSFRGFIRERLEEKCEERSIEAVRISSKDTRLVCSVCGETGKTIAGSRFTCQQCGYEATASLNGARNIEKKYRMEHG